MQHEGGKDSSPKTRNVKLFLNKFLAYCMVSSGENIFQQSDASNQMWKGYSSEGITQERSIKTFREKAFHLLYRFHEPSPRGSFPKWKLNTEIYDTRAHIKVKKGTIKKTRGKKRIRIHIRIYCTLSNNKISGEMKYTLSGKTEESFNTFHIHLSSAQELFVLTFSRVSVRNMRNVQIGDCRSRGNKYTSSIH